MDGQDAANSKSASRAKLEEVGAPDTNSSALADCFEKDGHGEVTGKEAGEGIVRQDTGSAERPSTSASPAELREPTAAAADVDADNSLVQCNRSTNGVSGSQETEATEGIEGNRSASREQAGGLDGNRDELGDAELEAFEDDDPDALWEMDAAGPAPGEVGRWEDADIAILSDGDADEFESEAEDITDDEGAEDLNADAQEHMQEALAEQVEGFDEDEDEEDIDEEDEEDWEDEELDVEELGFEEADGEFSDVEEDDEEDDDDDDDDEMDEDELDIQEDDGALLVQIPRFLQRLARAPVPKDDDDEPVNPNATQFLIRGTPPPFSLRSGYNHHQCCDSLAWDKNVPDEVVLCLQHEARVYTLLSDTVKCSIPVQFDHYSSMRYKDLLYLAGQGGLLVIFRLIPKPDGSYRTEMVAYMILTHRSNMVNSIRIGRIDGEDRVVVGSQCGHVYIFAVPDFKAASGGPILDAGPAGATATSCKAVVKSMLLPTLGNAAANSTTKEVEIFYGANLRLYSERRQSVVGSTCVIGPLGSHVNCALVSPDGRYMAVAVDRMEIVLLSAASEWNCASKATLPFIPPHLGSWSPHEAGCQYLAWSSDSRYVAASSDAACAVAVWQREEASCSTSSPSVSGDDQSSTPTASTSSRFQAIAFYSHHSRSILALQFHPSEPSILAFVETSAVRDVDSSKIHLRDVKGAGASQSFSINGGRINGLACTPKYLLLAAKYKFYLFPWISEWDISKWKWFTRRFQEAVRSLLLVASQGRSHVAESQATAQYGLWDLPDGVVQHIISCAAFPLLSWIEPMPADLPGDWGLARSKYPSAQDNSLTEEFVDC